MGHLRIGNRLPHRNAQSGGIQTILRTLQIHGLPEAVPGTMHRTRGGHGLRGRHLRLPSGRAACSRLRPEGNRHQTRGQLRHAGTRRRLLPRGPAPRQHHGARWADRAARPGHDWPAQRQNPFRAEGHDLRRGRAGFPQACRRSAAFRRCRGRSGGLSGIAGRSGRDRQGIRHSGFG